MALPKFIWQTTTSSYPSTPGQNTLLIRSSVLGGKVVSEALGPGTGVTTAAGSMSRSRVIAEGTEVATLKVGLGGASDAVLWPMIDPAQSSYRDTNGSGAVPNDPEAMAERDPAGANVQTENPYDSSNPRLLPPVGSSSLFSFAVTPMDQRVNLGIDDFVTQITGGSLGWGEPGASNAYPFAPPPFVDLAPGFEEWLFRKGNVDWDKLWDLSLEHMASLGDQWQPLTDCVKEKLKQDFPELDLDQIRVHTDGVPAIIQTFDPSPERTRAVTIGNDIYFPSGSYNPFTSGGIVDIGHELKHSDQYRRLGADGFVKQYAEGYINNIIGQISGGGMTFSFSHMVQLANAFIDIAGMEGANAVRRFENMMNEPNNPLRNVGLNLKSAYEEIPLEAEAYAYGDGLRERLGGDYVSVCLDE